MERLLMINRQQLELGLAGEPGSRGKLSKPRRMTRARWWFSQMRQIVDQAREWPLASVPEDPQFHLAKDKTR